MCEKAVNPLVGHGHAAVIHRKRVWFNLAHRDLDVINDSLLERLKFLPIVKQSAIFDNGQTAFEKILGNFFCIHFHLSLAVAINPNCKWGNTLLYSRHSANLHSKQRFAIARCWLGVQCKQPLWFANDQRVVIVQLFLKFASSLTLFT